MPEVRFPGRLDRSPRPARQERTCAAHRTWVRKHKCCVGGCLGAPIECAHVRLGTDGGIGLKPSDCWCVSLCRNHHQQQHNMGELAFQIMHDLDLIALAREFARRSPHMRD